MRVEVKKIPCPSCGADLRCRCQKLLCLYCGYTSQKSASPLALRYEPLRKELPNLEAKEYQCVSCGANFLTDSVATLCPYCKSALVADFTNPLRPKALIPFAICPQEAAKLVRKHIKSLWFAPNDFLRDFRKHKDITPFYYPLWLFNTDVEVSYEGMRGEYYYVTVTRYVNGKLVEVQERRTSWYPASGVVHLHFNDVGVGGYKEASPKLQSFRYDLTQCVALDISCLSGIESKEFDIASDEAFLLAQSALQGSIIAAIRRDIGGDEQRIYSYHPRYYNEEFSYVLAPSYHFSVKFKEKEYEYFINAQNGAVIGERPYSWVKIFFFVLFLLMLLGGVLYLLRELGYIT